MTQRRVGAGRYNRRIVVEQPTKTTGADGQRTAAWGTYATLWSAREPQAGSESQENQRLTVTQRWVFRVRSTSVTRGITTRMRVVLSDGTILGIASVRDAEDSQQEIEILAELSHR